MSKMTIQLNQTLMCGLTKFIDQNIEEIRHKQAEGIFEAEDMLKIISIIFSICNITGVKIPKIMQGICNFTDVDGMNDSFIVDMICSALIDLSYDIDQLGEEGMEA